MREDNILPLQTKFKITIKTVGDVVLGVPCKSQ